MKKNNKPLTINPKYLENIRYTRSGAKVAQIMKDKNENSDNFSRTYSDLMFKRNIAIHKIIHYLEKESKT